MFHPRNLYVLLIYFSLVYFIVITLVAIFRSSSLRSSCESYCLEEWQEDIDDISDFEGFDNDTGTPDGRYIVPNHVHFIRFMDSEVSYVHAACILAAFKHQKPEKIFIHYDWRPKGRYWDVLMGVPGFADVLVLNRVRMPDQIFEQEMTWNYRKWHSGDITRVRLLMKYGGIFLDNDSFFVRSVDDMRKFEAAVGWLEHWYFMNQAVIAHRNSRFVRLWHESYREYNNSDWYYNAGEKPTVEVLEAHPHLVHRNEHLLVTDQKFDNIYLYDWTEWRSHYIIHLNIRWTYALLRNLSEVAYYPTTLNETNIHLYNATIRDLMYDVFPPGFIQSSSSGAACFEGDLLSSLLLIFILLVFNCLNN